VRRVAQASPPAPREVLGGWPDGADVLDATFYRNKGAYLVGRLWRGAARCPLVVALLHDEHGVRADAVLTREEEASVVFGFAWSPFHVDAAEAVRPRALVALLASVLPSKRLDELYTAIGLHKHAKTELYRTLVAHLAEPGACFERAPGARGLVMEVVTLRSLNVVFKLIRDRFLPPKQTTRRHVMAQYQYVLARDRAGRLCDAQEFEALVVPRARMPDALLAELRQSAPSVVREEPTSDGAGRVVLAHCYVERRLTPLDLYVRGVDVDAATAAVEDYGCAIRDLAASGIFAGDLLLKNFGVSRHGRVIFYDYDELADLLACRFHALPDDDDESAMSAAHAAGEHDVFPEEFARFTLPAGPLRDAFLARHRDLLDPGWWEDVQRRLRAGEVVDVYPYPQGRRLG
jgi:isocitrate dehydrogenase kinase/phosphatase